MFSIPYSLRSFKCFLCPAAFVDYDELNAYDFGVLQSRKRMIIVGWLKGTGYEYPKFDIVRSKAAVWNLLKNLSALKPEQEIREYTINDMRRVNKYVKENVEWTGRGLQITGCAAE